MTQRRASMFQRFPRDTARFGKVRERSDHPPPPAGRLFRLDPPEPVYVAAACPPELLDWLRREGEKRKSFPDAQERAK